ncbi:hypothetical protein ABPG75_003888 [Micractinium tetrahymenae]
MAGWRERVLIGGIAISMLLHALVLFGGRSAAPAVPVSGMPQHGRKLQGLLDGVTGGLTGGDGLLGGLLGDLNVVRKLTITDGIRSIVIDPNAQTIATSTRRLNIGGVGNPHTLTTGALKAPGSVNPGNARIDGTATVKALTVNGVLTARNNVNVAGTVSAPKCTCAGKPASG